jgi:hypothetical protein
MQGIQISAVVIKKDGFFDINLNRWADSPLLRSTLLMSATTLLCRNCAVDKLTTTLIFAGQAAASMQARCNTH